MTSEEHVCAKGRSSTGDGELAAEGAVAGRTPIGTGQFPAFRRETLYARIAEHVRALIESRELQPGERLPPERELARLLGVSRVPIREAMRTLNAQGLIEVKRGQGMFVAASALNATVDELTTAVIKQRDLLRDLFAVRRLLEPTAAQWAATRHLPANLTRMQALLDEMVAAGSRTPPDYATLGKRDTELHVEIAAATQNRVLVQIMKAIQHLHSEQLETSLRYKGRIPETFKDHERIVHAIASKEGVQARLAMVEHLANAESATMSRLESGDVPQKGDAGLE